MKRAPIFIIFALFAFSTFGAKFQHAAYDEKKPTVFIGDRSIIESDSNGKNVLSDDGKTYLDGILNSGKFNLMFYENGYSGGDLDLVKDYLKSTGRDSKVVFYNDQSSADKRKIGKIYNGNNSFDNRNASRDLRSAFYKLVDQYHHPDSRRVGIRYGGKDPFNDLQSSIDVLFKFGPEAFKDGLSFDNFSPKIMYSKDPVTCEVDSIVIDMSVCVNFIEKEYKWVNAATKSCGLYEKGQTKLIETVNYLLCEPSEIQDFESSVNHLVVSTCTNARNCLDKFLSDEAKGLFDSFEAIVVHERVQVERNKIYEDKTHEYVDALESIASDFREFQVMCDDKHQQMWMQMYFRDNPNEKKLYDDLMDKTGKSYAAHLGPYLETKELDFILNEGKVAFDKCLKIESESGRGKIDTNDPDSFYKRCSMDRFGGAISSFIDHLGSEDEQKGMWSQFAKMKLSGICPTEKKSDRFNRRNRDVERFELTFDSERCFDHVKKLREDFENDEAFKDKFTLARRITEIINVRDDIHRRYLDEEFSNCMKSDEAKKEECVEESNKRALAATIYYSLSRKGTDYDDEKGVLLRGQRAKGHFIRKALEDDKMLKCYEEVVNRSKRVSECEEIAKENLLRLSARSFASSPINLAKSALYSDLEAYVKELDREVSVFHWGSDELSGFSEDEPVDLNSLRGYGYLRFREYMFHTGPFLDQRVDDPGNGTMAGRGLYAAGDPNSTSSYGQTLFEIRLPEGSRFLDLREENTSGKIPISSDTFRKLTKAGCKLDGYYSEKREEDDSDSSERRSSQTSSDDEYNPGSASNFVSRGYGSKSIYLVDKSVFEKFPECNKVFSTVVSKLDLNFLAYDYDMNKPAFCDNVNDSTAAFVMIDAPFSGNNTQYNRKLVEEAITAHREKGTPIPGRIKRILQVAGDAFRGYEDINEDVSDEDLVKYWKDRLFLCNGLNEEDRVQRSGSRY